MMTNVPPIPEFKLRLTDYALAELLGLSLDEFHDLSHKPIDANTDAMGKIVEFYIHVSSNNSPHLLAKLRLDKNNFVRFRPDEVYRHYT
jgi:hypothetical protein